MPKVPPNKKLKQTDLRSSFQQSRKQTARDDKSGETSQASDNVQERKSKLLLNVMDDSMMSFSVNTVDFLSLFKDLLETLQQRENLKNKSEVLKFIKEEYQKSVENFLVVKKVKQLMKLSDAVCQIRVEGSAIGTGFLLFDRFILTNAHVIGEFDPFSKKLSKTFTAVFGYEDLEANETKCVPIKEQVAAYYYGKDNMGRYLDFALLELKATDEIANGPGLLSRYIHGPHPNHGGICIVGHPGEGVKKMDPCFIIERENLQEAADKHASENRDFIHVMTQQCLAEKWENHDNKIHYDSCFFHGSSGSPVFDEHCYLIGVHTGGYAYPGAKQQIKSIVEYGYSMQPILERIITQAKKSVSAWRSRTVSGALSRPDSGVGAGINRVYLGSQAELGLYTLGLGGSPSGPSMPRVWSPNTAWVQSNAWSNLDRKWWYLGTIRSQGLGTLEKIGSLWNLNLAWLPSYAW
ncbi:unnamed protein product [Leuciscus chuanchicus]